MKDSYFIIKTRTAEKFIAALGLIFGLSFSINAAPPANDNFAAAQLISGAGGQASVVSNSEATKEANEPNHALNRGGRSVWYKYTAPGNGVLVLTTLPSLFNTTMAVYEGSSLSNLTLVAANNDISEGSSWFSRSKVTIGTNSGTTYYIAVDGNYDDNTGSVASGNVILEYSFINSAGNDNLANAVTFQNTSAARIVTTNVGASKESGEPNHGGNPGGKSVWFKWHSFVDYQKSITFALESKDVDSAFGINTLFAVYTGTSINDLTLVTGTVVGAYQIGKLTVAVQPNTNYYIAIDGYDAGSGAEVGTFSLSFAPTKSVKEADYDRDGRADLAVYRPTTGMWYAQTSIDNGFRAYPFGLNGDKPLIADFDRDGRHDYTVFRPDTGVWYINRSEQGFQAFNWGVSGDVPLVRKSHFNGSDYLYHTVFRASTGTWWMNLGIGGYQVFWGQTGDIPVLADFTGDGSDDFTVFRPSNGTWYILKNPSTYESQVVQFGLNGDKPVAADYDGDGVADIAVYRPSNGTWYVLKSYDGSVLYKQFGIASDKPQPADYDGDSRADFAVYRNGTWWISYNLNGKVRVEQFGLSSDVPLTAPVQ